MKIELIKQKFNGSMGYKYKPFSWCCDKIKENPCVVFNDEVCTDDYRDDECTFPAFALLHTETYRDWEDEFTQDTYYRIDYCPFCGEPIEISVVGEEDVSQYYKKLTDLQSELWRKCDTTDSKKEAHELHNRVHELDNKIDWFYQVMEYKKMPDISHDE